MNNDLIDFIFKDKNKVKLWLFSKNPMLGSLTPIQLIEIDRVLRLHQFINWRASENFSSKEEENYILNIISSKKPICEYKLHELFYIFQEKLIDKMWIKGCKNI